MSIVQTRVARLLAIASAALLASCAGAPVMTGDNEIDYVKVAQVERAARAFGTQVIWINYPTKRAEAAK